MEKPGAFLMLQMKTAIDQAEKNQEPQFLDAFI
jgi:hypothetical protein